MVIVNHHHGLAFTRVFGRGTMSSSDGQRFPTRGKSITARAMTRTSPADEGCRPTPTCRTSTPPTARRSSYRPPGRATTSWTNTGQRHRSADRRARHGHPRRHLINFALFDLVGRQLTPTDPGSRESHPVPDDTPRSIQRPVSARRAAADRPARPGADHRVGRSAADGRVVKFGQATASLIVGKLCSSKRQQNTLASGDEGVRGAAAHDPLRPVSVGPGVPAANRPAAQQGRVAARAAPRPVLRQRGRGPPPPPGAANRAGMVPDRADQRHDHLDHRVLRHGHRRLRAAGRHIPDEVLAHIWPRHQRERQLLRHHHRGRRRRNWPNSTSTDSARCADSAVDGRAAAMQSRTRWRPYRNWSSRLRCGRRASITILLKIG